MAELALQEVASYGFASLLPPLIAIGLAIYTRQVFLSLAAGIWLGHTILAGWNPAAGAASGIEGAIGVLGDAGNARVIVFTFLIGALIATVEANGGMRGFVRWVEEARWVTNGRRAQIMAWLIGIVVFIESNLTILVAGSVSRPLFDRFRVSREKLAYIIDSTSAPVCILIPFNAWGALVLGILAEQQVANPLGVFLVAIPLNLYAVAALALAGLTAIRGLDLGPMKKAEARTREGRLHWDHAVALADPEEIAPPPAEDVVLKPRNMLIPIAAMVVSMPVFMWITGGGTIAEGSGSTSVLWAVLVGLGLAWLFALAQRSLDLDGLSRVGLKGAGALTGMAVVLWLALSLGEVTRSLGTGLYAAGVVGDAIPLMALIPMVFVVTGAIAFATGSSWGTFAIMLAVAIPLANALGLPPAPFVAAVLSGGIFGDHCSPISDTTIIASLASATDHIEHVRTQIPYALIAGGIAALGFAVVGAMM
ncbi:Na+/H+ antiporter NhaC family protein [Candidatus Palauibacter sp.]|uniref:Na+/H+ antiporter NhaC family protein n=1 Tax=Candidatus Palauibacter sp. TaxID=3101350 RepID=UPI003AF2D40E